MKNKFLIGFAVFLALLAQSFSQEIFKNSIKDYKISLSKNAKNEFVLNVVHKNKSLLKKSYPIVKLYFYNLDSHPEDEMIIVTGRVENQDTINTLYVYTFEKSFKFCDSIYLGKYLPEFYQFDFESNYFIKIYDYTIQEQFPSQRLDLPFAFYYLEKCALKFDNEFSFEEYEAEINYLIDEISELKKEQNCNNESWKKDFQRLLACLYVNILNASKAFDFSNFIVKNYPCDDLLIFISKLENIYN